MPIVQIRHGGWLRQNKASRNLKNSVTFIAVKVVIDTNIVLDLFVFDDPESKQLKSALLDGLANKQLTWLSTQAMRDELERVLAYPKIMSRMAFYKVSSDSVMQQFDKTVTLVSLPLKQGGSAKTLTIKNSLTWRCNTKRTCSAKTGPFCVWQNACNQQAFWFIYPAILHDKLACRLRIYCLVRYIYHSNMAMQSINLVSSQR